MQKGGRYFGETKGEGVGIESIDARMLNNEGGKEVRMKGAYCQPGHTVRNRKSRSGEDKTGNDKIG